MAYGTKKPKTSEESPEALNQRGLGAPSLECAYDAIGGKLQGIVNRKALYAPIGLGVCGRINVTWLECDKRVL